MFECDRHGLSFIGRCCEHVAAAVDENRPLATKVFMDRLTDVHHLCPECIVPVEMWLSEYLRGASPMLEPYYSMNGMCGNCMREWYVATGLGDLGIAVQRAREVRRTIARPSEIDSEE